MKEDNLQKQSCEFGIKSCERLIRKYNDHINFIKNAPPDSWVTCSDSIINDCTYLIYNNEEEKQDFELLQEIIIRKIRRLIKEEENILNNFKNELEEVKYGTKL